MNEMLLYTGSLIIIMWGISHLIPIGSIIKESGDIPEDSKKIIVMESSVEGITLCFLGFVVILVTAFGDPESLTASIVYYSMAGMLVLMAVLTILTGARTSWVRFKICPFIKTLVAIIYIIGATF